MKTLCLIGIMAIVVGLSFMATMTLLPALQDQWDWSDYTYEDVYQARMVSWFTTFWLIVLWAFVIGSLLAVGITVYKEIPPKKK